MGPALNPNFWFFWCGFLVIGVLVGTATFYLLKRWINSSVAVIIALSISILICCSAFNWSLSGPPSPKTQPKFEEIVGSWEISPLSRSKIQAKGNSNDVSHTLEFKEDGTFIMTNMPVWWSSGYSTIEEQADGIFDSGGGTWAIEKNREGEWLIEVHLKRLNEEKADKEKNIYLLGHESPYSVYVWYLDDMDSGIIEFERAANN